jgi:hypothetical protein
MQSSGGGTSSNLDTQYMRLLAETRFVQELKEKEA